MNEAPLSQFELRLPLVVRLCRAEDLPQLEWFGAFRDHREIIQEAFALQVRGEAVMLVAEANGFPVGQAWLDLRPRDAAEGPMVWAVRVLDPLQGLGIGARLMDELERLAWERGYAVLELGVDKQNQGARRFYERIGWRVARDRRDSYAYTTPEGAHQMVPLDEWVMVKELAQAGRSSPTRA